MLARGRIRLDWHYKRGCTNMYPSLALRWSSNRKSSRKQGLASLGYQAALESIGAM